MWYAMGKSCIVLIGGKISTIHIKLSFKMGSKSYFHFKNYLSLFIFKLVVRGCNSKISEVLEREVIDSFICQEFIE